MMSKISVIIPIYNTGKYLERCLDRIVNQTFKDIEIICINDCSTDNSLNILQTFALKDKRIKILNMPKRKGVAAARNCGLKIATGEYIGFVDSDDLIDLNFYEELYKKAAETNADIVKGKMCVVNADNTTETNNLNDLIKSKSKMYFSYDFTTAIYKSLLLSKNNIKFPENLVVSEDIVFLNSAVIKAKSIECIDNVNYYYCRRKRSLNSEKMSIRKMKSFLLAIEYIINNCNAALGKELSEDIYVIIYYSQLKIIREYLLRKNDTYKSHYLCVEKFVELYEKCKTPEKLEQMFSFQHGAYLHFIQMKNIDGLVDIFVDYEIKGLYKTIEQTILAKLRRNVNKNSKKYRINDAGSICNNTSI